jgi:hypothetical protein
VLRPDGRLIVVTPAADHLGELVGPLDLLRVDPDKAARLAASLEPALRPVATAVHREQLALPRGDAGTLVGMGPHARHTTPAAVAAARSIESVPTPTRATTRSRGAAANTPASNGSVLTIAATASAASRATSRASRAPVFGSSRGRRPAASSRPPVPGSCSS